MLSSFFGSDYKKIKPLFSNKDSLYSFFNQYLENIKKINTKRNRRK